MGDKRVSSRIALLFTLLSALFMVLSSQFFSFIFPILLIVPIYMGLKGLRAEKKSGFYFAMGIIPLCFAVSVLWFKYFSLVIKDYNKELQVISNSAKISVGSAGIILSTSFILSLIMFILSIVVLILLIKNKKIFK